jgi:diaminopimelate epimerase
MISFNYTKMSGAGNTFIMVDGKELPEGTDLAALAPVVCADDLEHGGADGFIAIEPWKKGDFEMRYYNRDGSTGMMCGNGGRCAVRFACDHGYVRDAGEISFINAGVVYRAAMTEQGVKVWFPEPKAFRFGWEIDLLGRSRTCHYADVGTPHAVIFIDELGEPELHDVAQLDLTTWGPPLRAHARFGPDGANANFVEVRPDNSGLLLRTFERGVEAETGACGTGAISSAIIAAYLRGLHTPVSVTTSSGKTLRVDFKIGREDVTDVSLEGDAEVVMKGKLVMKDEC